MQTQRKIFRYLVTCILSKKGELDLERSHLLASIMLEILLVFSKKNIDFSQGLFPKQNCRLLDVT
ncbi:hypothetical protein T06_3688 [Trichinella sp. T6]|nr:hypothetical protein T06_3688 [Trichinella sp. T6]